MIKVGCTGGMGAGKSLFCSYLAAQGAIVIDADIIAHQLLENDLGLKDSLVSHFGIQVLSGNGDISRSNLARVAFASPQAHNMLNAITHPYIRKVIAARIGLLSQSTGIRQLLILEGALLVETNAMDFYELDSLVVVEAPDDLVVDRLRSKRAMVDSDIDQRLSAQIDKLTRIKAADYVVFNSADKNLLNSMAQNIHRELLYRYGKIAR